MTHKYAVNTKAPSVMFLDSITSGGGSHYMVCGNCGRTHYCPDSFAVEDNESDDDEEADVYKNYLEDALAEQKKNPDGVMIHYNVDFVATKDLHGIVFVLECPCNGLTKYEEFIWNNKDPIRRYLKARIEQEYVWTQEQLTLNKLAGIK